ncbi:methyltransferase domain-containing protein [Ancylobacter mangrovi]|uniref:methyltransferase domain-containing protein n=1 Tax=Ancylobacter mangrovi TaxID=2972472 RepID=UPI0021635067|nr:methyltransferase domain-containing protein [Ancylobacter mangrovi]MCS0503946.1 methyltransferase domain-containing protein [Ancylobacter mangrovi]
MEFTGERFVPGVTGPIASEHQHRYAFASQFVAGLDVLDVSSGEGYGSAFLARSARSVVGVDIDPEAVAHAEARYGRPAGPRFQFADIGDLPFPDASFDVVVSFETIEHVRDPAHALGELRRVLKPDGVMIISTPDRDVFTDRIGNRNPFHLAEMSADEFVALLAPIFPTVRLYGQRTTFASFLSPIDMQAAALSGPDALWWLDPNGLTRSPAPAGEPVYLVAVCSRSPQPIEARSVLVDAASGDANPIETLQSWANSAVERADRCVEEHERARDEVRRIHDEQAATIARQAAELAQLGSELAAAQERLAERDSRIDHEAALVAAREELARELLAKLRNTHARLAAADGQAEHHAGDAGTADAPAQDPVAELMAELAGLNALAGSLAARSPSGLVTRLLNAFGPARTMPSTPAAEPAMEEASPAPAAISLEAAPAAEAPAKDTAEPLHIPGINLVRRSGVFDIEWYARAYGVEPDGAIEHYLTIGHAIGCNPSANFDGRAYLDANPDVRAANINPLLHYLVYGVHEGRSFFNPPRPAQPALRDAGPRGEVMAISVGEFRPRNAASA